jgi:signal transduction histidine kinase
MNGAGSDPALTPETRHLIPDAMSEVLRLLRLSLILRLVIAIVAAIISSMSVGSFPPVALLAASASFAMIVVISVAMARGRTDVKTANRLLVAVIVAQAVETMILGMAFGGRVPPEPGTRPEGQPEFPWMNALLMRGALASAFFYAIPTMLGAWIGGRRSVLRWTIFAVLCSFIADLIAIAPNWNAIPFIAGTALSQAVVVAILAFFVASLADQLRREQAQLRLANEQLAEQARVREQLATTRERVRLSRDLHDTLAHTLAGLVVQMNAIDTLMEVDPPAARAELNKAQVTAKRGLEETRAAISDLRANIVEELGLSGALQRQSDVLQQRTSATVIFESCGKEPQLSKEQAETLFRIAQEAMNNIERHAQAKQVHVKLDTCEGMAVSIKDDGIGFDADAMEDDRFGLRGMRERAELIGAHLRVDSTAGHGTSVTVSLPAPSA